MVLSAHILDSHRGTVRAELRELAYRVVIRRDRETAIYTSPSFGTLKRYGVLLFDTVMSATRSASRHETVERLRGPPETVLPTGVLLSTL